MSRDELLKRLAECDKRYDTEGAHVDADNALLDYINDDEIRAAYKKIHRWYA